MFLNRFYNGLKDVLVEENDAFEIQLWTQQVKKYILTVAFI